jgi:hypothetical protein
MQSLEPMVSLSSVLIREMIWTKYQQAEEAQFASFLSVYNTRGEG